jgi:hypothetical protein
VGDGRVKQRSCRIKGLRNLRRKYSKKAIIAREAKKQRKGDRSVNDHLHRDNFPNW